RATPSAPASARHRSSSNAYGKAIRPLPFPTRCSCVSSRCSRSEASRWHWRGCAVRCGCSLATALGGVIMLVFETAIGAGLAQSIAEGRGLTPDLILQPHIWLPLVGLGLLALVPVAVKRFRSGSD